LVHGVLVSRGPFLPSLVFVGLFVFPLGGGTGQTDRRTGSTHNGLMGPPSRKDGPIISKPPESRERLSLSNSKCNLQFTARSLARRNISLNG